MYEHYQVLASAEAAALWGLDGSTVRQAIRYHRLSGQKSGGTWLVTTVDMVSAYGGPRPILEEPAEQICYIENDHIPLIFLGCVQGNEGRCVLRTPDASIIVINRDILRQREEEQWVQGEASLSLVKKALRVMVRFFEQTVQGRPSSEEIIEAEMEAVRLGRAYPELQPIFEYAISEGPNFLPEIVRLAQQLLVEVSTSSDMPADLTSSQS